MNPLKLANPITVTKGAWGLAGTTVGLAGAIAGRTTNLVLSLLDRSAEQAAAPVPTADWSAREASLTETPDELSIVQQERELPGPDVVAVEPHAPEEPPVDVVGEALAAEAAAERGEGTFGAGLAHEPRGASRDEEHGDAQLQRAEVDEIAEEVAAALEGDPEPVEHLTEPLLDPAEAKAITAEMTTLRKAADPARG